jgi:hypothetical protein
VVDFRIQIVESRVLGVLIDPICRRKMGIGMLGSPLYWQEGRRRALLAVQLAQPKCLLEDHRAKSFHNDGPHVLGDDGDPTARAPDGMVWVVCGVGLDVPQDAGQTEGVSALADAGADKVAEADGTTVVVVVVADRDALPDHLYRIPAHAVIGPVEGILVGIHLERRSPRQEECVFGGRVQVKHGRICFLTDRGPVLGTSAAVVIMLVPVVPSMVVATAIPRVAVVGRDRSILSRGGGGRKVKVQEFVCMLLLLLTAVCTLLL